MKKNVLFRESNIYVQFRILLVAFLAISGTWSLQAQVSFTQTTDADFNKGVLNNVIVSSNNVYLQLSASGVGSWLTTTVLPQIISGHRAVSWNDRYAYVIGGYNDVSYLNTVYMGNIQSGTVASWSAQNPLPVALRDPAVVIGTNTIYVMGGRDGSQVYNTIYYATINTDGSLGAWQTSAVTLPAARWGHTATYVMGYIYIAGGSASMTESTALNTVYYAKVYATNTLSAFSAGTNLPAARNRHAAVTYNRQLYILGGYDNSGTKASTVYYCTPSVSGSTGGWSTGTALPVAVSNHSATVTNGVISVMAGAVGATLSNTVYFTNADVFPLSWSTSPNVMYDFTKDGSAFTGNGQVYYTGGVNLSGTSIINCRYANMTLTTNYIAHGVFVSNPYYELGTDRVIDSLTFHKAYTAPANLEVAYRTASGDGIWSNWSALTPTSPVVIGLTKQYLQYAVILTGSGTNNSTLNDMTLFTPGTELSGSLNAITTFTKALSPYWVTGDISFTSGTHTFEAGTTLLFLPQTGLTVGQANVICNGTAVDSVKFLYFTAGSGNWDGLYFDANSDNGVSSQLYYTVISGAGYGSNNANLTCLQTNEPLLSRCHIRYADGHGIHLNTAHINIQNSLIRANTENGFYLAQSSPTLVSTTISYNTGAGVYLTSSASNPNFSAGTVTIDHNTYAMRYDTPNLTIIQPNGNPVFTANTYNGIAINAGDITSNQRWNAVTYDYILLGRLRIGSYGGACRLTIEPGNTVKSLAGVQIHLGFTDASHGGELYALGTVDSVITFTSHNGVAGGWEGIYFTDNSDNWGGQSQLDYCVIENGNAYNYYSVSTSQPNLINHSIIRNSVQDGARYNNATGSITNCQFLTNGRYPLYFLNPEANPVHTGNTYSGNTVNRITLSGGTYSFDRTYNLDGGGIYYVLSSIIVAGFGGHPRLTFDAGVTVDFEIGTKLQLGEAGSYGGELYAVGTSVSKILFRAKNTTNGGWEGIHFTDYNDNWGGVSTMEYCTINHGNAQDILIETSSQPSMNNCTVQKSAGHGIVVYNSNPVIQNCTFTQCTGYPLKYNDWRCNAYLRNNTYTSNGLNYIALSGGTYDASRPVYFQTIPYHVLGNIVMGLYANHARLTVQPGVTMLFNPGIKLQLGFAGSYGGDLWAEGKADSLITFKAFNNVTGGWEGIHFTEYNDNWSGTSNMTYCVVSQGNAQNLLIEYSAQPTMTNCTIQQSAGHGAVLFHSNPVFQNNTFTLCANYPLKYNDWTCNAYLRNNIYTSNGQNYIALSGGFYDEHRTVYYQTIPYQVLGDIIMGYYAGHVRLTVQPGVTMLFNPGIKLQLGSASSYGGDLWAEGKADSLITFKPFNDLAGGWAGINFTEWNDNWSGTSSLKYCVVEKGASYNISCTNSGQPAIDHCTLRLSTGNGLVISNSNPTIRNTNIVYNATNGIYIDGSVTSTIGNSDLYTCNILNNLGYELYNNGTADVNARYNYWGTGDSTMVGFRIYDKSDNSAKGRVNYVPFAQVASLFTTNTLLSGTVKYANVAATTIKNAPMAVKNFAGTTIASTTTNASGVFAFPSFASGNYQMTISPVAPAWPWTPCNATDALGILNHFAMIAPLTGIKMGGADVNSSHTINGTDAMHVLKRFNYLIATFPAGEILYDSDTVIVNGSNVTDNIRLLYFGDVDASFIPAKKSVSSLGLVIEGKIAVDSYTDFDFPVKLKTGMKVGAISMGFHYPAAYLEITGVRLAGSPAEVTWNTLDGTFRMAWADLNSLTVADDEVMVIISMKSKDLTNLMTGIELEICDDAELADPLATPNDGAVVAIPAITGKSIGIGPEKGLTGLSVFPNPVTMNSVASFSLVKESRVKLALMNAIGARIRNLTDADLAAGDHRVPLRTSELKPGIYFLKIEVTDSVKSYSDIVKVVVSE